MSSTIVISPPRPATIEAVDEPSSSADTGPSSPTPNDSLSHALSDFYRCGASHDEALLQQLQRCACEPYDAAAHLPLWRRLWARAALGPSEASCELPSAKWLQLGFQGDDPSVDLRGAGALGLRQLLHFCESGAGATVLAKHHAAQHEHVALQLAATEVELELARQQQSTPSPPPHRGPPQLLSGAVSAATIQRGAAVSSIGSCGLSSRETYVENAKRESSDRTLEAGSSPAL